MGTGPTRLPWNPSLAWIAAASLLILSVPAGHALAQEAAASQQGGGPAPQEGAAPESSEPAVPAASAPLPPLAVSAQDLPNDNGHGIEVRWQEASPGDPALLGHEVSYARQADAPDTAWLDAGMAPRGTASIVVQDEEETMQGKPNPKFIPTGVPIHVRVRSVGRDGGASAWTAPVAAVARGNWFHTGKINVFVTTLVFGALVVAFIVSARRGKELYVRPIPGLSAVDEAIGRATEMGKPILYVLGTGTAGDIATIAGYTILARVAKRTAEYQTPILVPVNDPVMMAMGQEVVREAYLEAGRPEVYRPENINYISAMQFPYVAAVNGLMLRERTATNFYMGVFHAESLLLAEAGSATGAIQISGTDQVSQIPFFVAATDYTLIGEELYAASAYLSQDPVLLGPLKAQDYTKLAIIAVIIGGVLALSLFQWDGILKLVQSAT